MSILRVNVTALSARAARNNATWCDTVCRMTGSGGDFCEFYWHSKGRVPRFYPNLVTLSEDQTAIVAQIDEIRRATCALGLVEWTVKDSFHCLDLTSLGFVRKFEASWLWRNSSQPPPSDVDAGIRWSRVATPGGLEEWEREQNNGMIDSRVFHESILREPDVVILAAHRDSRLIGGAIANRSAGVVGVSNVFARPHQDRAFWGACVVQVSATFPGLPLTGYERGRHLLPATEVGFEFLNPLSVWIFQAKGASKISDSESSLSQQATQDSGLIRDLTK